ncbi:MarR family winged helix-turn-helix transcriptional regulator [Streptacidiphilus albus]|uniref:MarR family winged helix-turn-helix transcriptional regulator n=1 Tax=Streptacidiphilus albus TaxID=105425 RepID=UPI00054B6494|nr:MarR family winged helix-turn-helix transcriptional regulator [Streptacidiphilus albus]
MVEFLDLHSRTSKVLRVLSDGAMRRHGLHLGQNYLLAALWEQDGGTPGELATALNVTTPTVVKMADRMTAAGLLTRRRDDRDNRLVRLWLTDAGRALQQPVEAERRSIEERVTADLTDTEREHLMRALAKVYRSASELLREPADRDPATG